LIEKEVKPLNWLFSKKTWRLMSMTELSKKRYQFLKILKVWLKKEEEIIKSPGGCQDSAMFFIFFYNCFLRVFCQSLLLSINSTSTPV